MSGEATSSGETQALQDVFSGQNFDLLAAVPVRLSVEAGSTSLSLADLMALGEGSIVDLNRQSGDLLDIMVNGAVNQGWQLVLKGPSGSANSFSVLGPNGLTYPNDRNGLTRVQSAEDAVVRVDGVDYTSPNNTVTTLLPGVELSLKKAKPGEIVMLDLARPTEALRSTISDLATAFNNLRKSLADARSSTQSRAVFELERSVARLFTQPLSSSSDGPRTLADLGLATNRDGSISLNSSTLETALRNWPTQVEALFTPVRNATQTEATDPGLAGVLQTLQSSVTNVNGGLSALNARLQKDVDTLTGLRNQTEARAASYKDRLARDLGGMDSRVAALKATQSYLSQQIAQWNRTG